jgi:hypothetical protein
MLTFNEFQKTKERVTVSEAADRLQVDPEVWKDVEASVLIYDGSLYIFEHNDGHYSAPIAHNEYIADELLQVERELYLEWYAPECATVFTTAQLIDALELWCEHNNLEPESADMLQVRLFALPPDQRSLDVQKKGIWIDWYVDTWERTVEKEDTPSLG